LIGRIVLRHAVQEDEREVRVAAADLRRRETAAAGGRDVEAGDAAQHVGYRRRLRAVDRRTVEDGDGRRRRVERPGVDGRSVVVDRRRGGGGGRALRRQGTAPENREQNGCETHRCSYRRQTSGATGGSGASGPRYGGVRPSSWRRIGVAARRASSGDGPCPCHMRIHLWPYAKRSTRRVTELRFVPGAW